eukprot:CFRG4301T1
MSFIQEPSLARRQRFSLLLLEPGEVYFEDYSVFCSTIPLECIDSDDIAKSFLEGTREKGRLKICSKSVVFDPLDIQRPVLRIPFRCVTQLQEWPPKSESETPNTQKIHHEDKDVLKLVCTTAIEMRENNAIAPYHFKHGESVFLFTCNYVRLATFNQKLIDLWDISSLSPTLMGEQLQTIIDEHREQALFDRNWLESLYEDIAISVSVEMVSALTTNPGRAVLTNAVLYFQSFNNIQAEPVQKYRLNDLLNLVNRRYLLKEKGLELFFTDGKSLFFSFESQNYRDRFVVLISRQPSVSRLLSSNCDNMIQKWQKGEVDNFTYLLYLNSVADRSFNDLTQYPVFPWVIADYTSDELDLKNPNTFRDLSKPIGALNEERLKGYRERYADMPDPKYMYATHYSTPGYVLYYLVRIAPEYMLCLQNGKFDQPDRLFNDVGATWVNVNRSHTDVKELIPEFYMRHGHQNTGQPTLSHSPAPSPSPGSKSIYTAPRYNTYTYTSNSANSKSKDLDLIENTNTDSMGYKIDSVYGTTHGESGKFSEELEQENEYTDFLVNNQHLPLGRKQDGTVINDVVLPPWASGADDFIDQCRLALECEYVSARLHLWIDLIFGYKQRGEESIKADNVFHYLTYEGTIDLDSIEDPHEKEAITMQILEFGQTPKQLFNVPHPPRNMINGTQDEELSIQDSFREFNSRNPTGSSHEPAVLDLKLGLQRVEEDVPTRLVVKDSSTNASQTSERVSKPSIYSPTYGHTLTPSDRFAVTLHSLHQGQVTGVCFDGVNADVVYSIGADSTLRAFSLAEKHQLRSLLVCELRLSTCAALPDTEFIVLGAWDNRLYFYSRVYGRVVFSWRVHEDAISCLKAREGMIVTASWDSTVKVWAGWGGGTTNDVPTDPSAYLLYELSDHMAEICAIDIDESCSTIASASSDGDVIIYKIDRHEGNPHVFPVSQFIAHTGAVNGIVLTSNGEILVTCGMDKRLCVWSVEDGSSLFSTSFGSAYTCLSLSGLIVVCGTESGHLHAWDIVSHARVLDMQVHSDRLESVTISSCGTKVVCATSNRDIAVLQLM